MAKCIKQICMLPILQSMHDESLWILKIANDFGKSDLQNLYHVSVDWLQFVSSQNWMQQATWCFLNIRLASSDLYQYLDWVDEQVPCLWACIDVVWLARYPSSKNLLLDRK